MPSHLGVLVGFACNIKCKHCCTAHMDPGYKLTAGEIRAITQTINKFRLSELAFVGGEPTLYVKEINLMLAAVERLARTKVILTTNGNFAVTEAAALEVLDSFEKLTKVHMSYDKFHGEFVNTGAVKNLYQACLKRDIDFDVLFAVQEQSKPKTTSSYNHMKKFTAAKLCYPTPERLMASDFYKLAASVPFRRWPKMLNIPKPDYTPAQSAECSLCESLIERYEKKMHPDKKNGNSRDIQNRQA
ncbi:MAG: radical SAM protein [Elusimicrobia bacterium]|nr:radical SAM protein [Elusimicrobiota bacterium]